MGSRDPVGRGTGPGPEGQARGRTPGSLSAASGQKAEARAGSPVAAVPSPTLPLRGSHYCAGSLAHGRPCLAAMFWKGVLTFFFQDGLRHKQSAMVGIRPPGSRRFYPVFVISLETAGAEGRETGMHVSRERPGPARGPLCIRRGHVTLARPFHNRST